MGLVKPLPAQVAKIKVVGVGGGGGNAVNFMASQKQIQGVDLVAINTDAQALLASQAKIKIQIGEKLTRGLGSGGDPKIGQEAADESREKISEVLEGTDMVFVTGGLGGGTCSGAASVVAEIAKEELNILTVAVVTKPFLFEGTRRMVVAEDALERLKEKVDALIVVPNQKLLEFAGEKDLSFLEAFKLADSVLAQGVQGIADLITTPGLINLDFADIRSVMKNSGTALMGIGVASGEDRAKKAIEAATSSPLLDINIEGARGVLFNVSGGSGLTIREVEEAAKIISSNIGGDATVVFGATIDEELKDEIKITVIATGFDLQRRALAGLIKPRPASQIEEAIRRVEEGSQEDKDPVVKIDLEGEEKEEKRPAAIKDLPEGVEIESELDIPSFLRRGSN